METNKKIIVGVVALIMAGGFGLYLKSIFFKPTPDEIAGRTKISIPIPEVNESLIDEPSKKEQYDNESVKENLAKNPFFDSNQQEEIEEEPQKQDFFKDQEHEELSNRKKGTVIKKTKKQRKKKVSSRKQVDDDDLMMIMAMQEQLEEEQNKLLEDQYRRLAESQYLNPNIQNQLTNGANQVSDNKSNMGFSSNQNGFFGTVNRATNNKVRDLIPAETVDKVLITQGSTIALRTKQEAKIDALGITIPKNAVVYGKAQFQGADRMNINIESYKVDDKLYPLSLRVFDFDGREGVHLSNRTWTKIPAKLANDVYEYAYRKGTQQSTFGGNNQIDSKEAGTIAGLSAAKEITDEILKKRKVMMPRKYHLWINVETTGR